jgi:hypothetical protein
MSKIKNVSSNVCAVFMFALEVCQYAYMFLRALLSPKAALAARLLAAAVRQFDKLTARASSPSWEKSARDAL